jgi:hypothetical protein
MYLTFIFLGPSDGAYLGSSLHYNVSAMLTLLTGRHQGYSRTNSLNCFANGTSASTGCCDSVEK